MRRALGVAGGGILLVLAAVLGIVAAVVGFFGAAFLVPSIPVLALVGALALLLATFALAWLGSRLVAPAHRLGLALGVAVGLLVLVGVLAAFTVFDEREYSYTPAEETDETRYWELSTGSRIAYEHEPAQGEARPAPVIWLHGGPGYPAGMPGYGGAPGTPPLNALTQDGFDVYYYDQLGGGLSTRLDDPSEYTVERHVADLEAIREEIGAEKVILIGLSWGGVLTENYMLEHPGRVEKVVFESPGPMWGPAYENATDPAAEERVPLETRREGETLLSPTPRLITWNVLSQVNPEAAQNFAGDHEMGGFFEAISKLGTPPVCDPTKPPPVRGLSFYVNQYTDLFSLPDRRDQMAQNQTPALVLRGECDYLKWEVTREWRDVLPNARLVYIEGAGHLMQLDKPDEYLEAVRAFLLEEPLPEEPYTEDASPGEQARSD